MPQKYPRMPEDAPKKNTFQKGFPSVGNEDFKPITSFSKLRRNSLLPDRGDDELPNSPQLVSELDTNYSAEVVKTVVLTTSASVVLSC